jgi:hypothetical protein
VWRRSASERQRQRHTAASRTARSARDAYALSLVRRRRPVCAGTLCQELQKTGEMVTPAQRKKEGDVEALCNYYTLANKQVAILCNHQKAAADNHGEKMAKLDEQIEAIRVRAQTPCHTSLRALG